MKQNREKEYLRRKQRNFATDNKSKKAKEQQRNPGQRNGGTAEQLRRGTAPEHEITTSPK